MDKIKSNWKKILMIALIIFFFILLMVWIYKHYFQFNNDLVNSYINREANKYEDSASARALLRDGCKTILSDRNATNQVLKVAKLTNVDKECVLVSAALASLKNFQYIA